MIINTANKSTSKFNIGDVVQSKAGGPNMVVYDIEENDIACTFIQSPYGDTKEVLNAFNPKCLKLITPCLIQHKLDIGDVVCLRGDDFPFVIEDIADGLCVIGRFDSNNGSTWRSIISDMPVECLAPHNIEQADIKE